MEDIKNLANIGYKFEGVLGKGCYGKVYKVKYTDAINGEVDLACKYIIKKKWHNNIFLTKFLPRELEILKLIHHSSIIRTQSIFQSGSSIFIFMRLAENGDLLNYIKTKGIVKESIANFWFYQLASGVDYLHSLNIAHRDLKCENILITKNLNVKIADFGFAKFNNSIDDFFSNNATSDLSETYCGSAAYAPPEVVSGTPYNIMKVDVWALGIILAIMINGRMPFDDTNITKLIINQKNRAYSLNEEVMTKISFQCKLIIHNCLEPNPFMRWDIKELLNAPWLKNQVERHKNK